MQIKREGKNEKNNKIIKLFLAIGLSFTLVPSVLYENIYAEEIQDDSRNITPEIEQRAEDMFPDKGLREAILFELSFILDDYNNDYDLAIANLDSLECLNAQNLDGISHLTNLEDLTLRGTDVENIEELSSLKKLRMVELGKTKVKDYSPLVGLPNLRILSAYENNLSDLSSIEKLTQLTTLYLDGNNISNINSLANLTQLETLTLSINHISDISALKNLKKLKSLDLSLNQISDITPLQSLTNLNELYLEENRISEDMFNYLPDNFKNNLNYEEWKNEQLASQIYVEEMSDEIKNEIYKMFKDSQFALLMIDYCESQEAIPNNTEELMQIIENITELKINENDDLSNLNGIEHLKNLKSLIVSGKSITDLTPLSKLQKLEQLNISNTAPKDLKAIENLSLTYLDAANTGISDVTSISKINTLKKLYLEDNDITDISLFSNLTNLEELNISRNKLLSLNGIQNSKNLNTIIADSNDIKDISALKELYMIKNLSLYDNNISNLLPLSALKELHNLNLKSNNIPVSMLQYLPVTYQNSTTNFEEWKNQFAKSQKNVVYAIKVETTQGGNITPIGENSYVFVNENDNVKFSIKPNKGYIIEDVKINGRSVGKVTSYIFKNVKSDATISVIFVKEESLVVNENINADKNNNIISDVKPSSENSSYSKNNDKVNVVKTDDELNIMLYNVLAIMSFISIIIVRKKATKTEIH